MNELRKSVARMKVLKRLPAGQCQVTNVVSHSNMGYPIDLNVCAIALKGRYNPSVFPAVVTRCKETQTTPSQFKSGKLVIAGAKSEEKSLYAAYNYAATVQRVMGLPVSVYNFEINNVVGQFNLGYSLNLNLLYLDQQLFTHWDPEVLDYYCYIPAYYLTCMCVLCAQVFPGACYKPNGSAKGTFSFVLFNTGRGIITGGRSTQELSRVFHEQRPTLAKYRAGNEYRLENNESLFRQREWTKPAAATATTTTTVYPTATVPVIPPMPQVTKKRKATDNEGDAPSCQGVKRSLCA